MYSSDLKHGLKLNTFKQFDHNIMLKTIQNLCYSKNGVNMTSPFLVDNILHQQKTVNFHNQYLNQQIENYVLHQRQNCQNFEQSRENSPEMDDSKMADAEEERQETAETKIEQDEDSKSRDEDESYNNVKNEVYYNDYYRDNAEKEILTIPNLNRRCSTCGAFDCPPFSCKKSGLRRLEELEKRFNLNYHDNSGDEADVNKEKVFTDDIVRSCEDYSEQKKPLLKFSVSAILGDREDSAKHGSINEARFEEQFSRLYGTTSVSVQVSPPLLDIETKRQFNKYTKVNSEQFEGISLIFSKEQNKGKSTLRDLTVNSSWFNERFGFNSLRSISYDQLHNRSLDESAISDSKLRSVSTSKIPLDSIYVKAIGNSPGKIDIFAPNISKDIGKGSSNFDPNNDSNIAFKKEKPIVVSSLTSCLDKSDEAASFTIENTYNNFLGVIYSPIVNTNNVCKSSQCKIISDEMSTTLDEISETIPAESKKDNSKTCVKTSPEIKKSVSFKLDAADVAKLKEKDETEKDNTKSIIKDGVFRTCSLKSDDSDFQESLQAVISRETLISDVDLSYMNRTLSSISESRIENIDACIRVDLNSAIGKSDTVGIPSSKASSKVSFKRETLVLDNDDIASTIIKPDQEDEDVPTEPKLMNTEHTKLKVGSWIASDLDKRSLKSKNESKPGRDTTEVLKSKINKMDVNDENAECSSKIESNIKDTNANIADTESQINVIGEPKETVKTRPSWVKFVEDIETDTSDDEHEEAKRERDKKIAWLKRDTDNETSTSTEHVPDTQIENPDGSAFKTETTSSKLKFITDYGSDESNLHASKSTNKSLTPERVRRSASRVTFVDEVVNLSTGNIFKIQNSDSSCDIVSVTPKSASLAKLPKKCFLDEVALFKYKLDQKLSILMNQEATTSRCDEQPSDADKVFLRSYLSGDARVFEGVASDSKLNDLDKQKQDNIHQTLSLDRSEFSFSSNRSVHEATRKDSKHKYKDDKKDEDKKREK